MNSHPATTPGASTPCPLPPAVGSHLKMAVTANLGTGIHMADVDFTCEFFRKGAQRTQLIEKPQMTYVADDQYIAVVDTAVVGAGEYFLRFTALIPDPDIEGGMRRETVIIPTGIRVVQ